MKAINTYIGRFAPSPTGQLHFGSLVAALASYLDARSNHGQWLLRIEDLDPPRESASAPEEIISQLTHFGFVWDGDVLFQSARLDAYQTSLDQLTMQKLCYPCICSRKAYGKTYPNTCRNRPPSTKPFATRLVTQDAAIRMHDSILGDQTWYLQKESGDFIIKRKDGLFAYQLAVVVDDAYQQVTHIIRGSDLLDSTPKQEYIRQCLALPFIQHAHIPVILGSDGNKLSKQANAEPISQSDSAQTLNLALKALGQTTIPAKTTSMMMQQAIESWQIDKIPKVAGLMLSKL
ncbi:MAG: glutamyl-Q tRNA(Asp) synthetase [Candidatus Azotimanducaceae bacterium]|jgi:glutamyl-Q tRNA(Asp) synthetase